MRLRNVSVICSALVVVLVLAAAPTQAGTYSRGHVSPSGNGFGCTPPFNPCVDLINGGTTLEVVGGPADGDYLPIDVEGVTPGSTVTFTFVSLPGAGFFNILDCGSDPTGNSSTPGIYQQGGTNLGIACSQESGTTITEVDDATMGTIALTFKGSLLSSSWGFAELAGGPTFTGDTVTPGTVATPEPGSMALLAAGLVGVGIFRRKQAV